MAVPAVLGHCYKTGMPPPVQDIWTWQSLLHAPPSFHPCSPCKLNCTRSLSLLPVRRPNKSCGCTGQKKPCTRIAAHRAGWRLGVCTRAAGQRLVPRPMAGRAATPCQRRACASHDRSSAQLQRPKGGARTRSKILGQSDTCQRHSSCCLFSAGKQRAAGLAHPHVRMCSE